MTKILFLCHGNICRSPMAEYICKHLSAGQEIYIESKAVSSEEIGNGIYPPAAAMLRQKGIPFGHHRARKMTAADYENFDYIVIMESYNMRRLLGIIGSDSEGKVSRLLDFTDTPGDIEDPWYSGNFQGVYDQIYKGCQALLQRIKEK